MTDGVLICNKKYLFLYLGVFFIFAVQINYADIYRLHKCESVMKKTLASILKRSNETESLLLTPFHETIINFKNDSEAYQRIMWGCFSIFRFEKCLSLLDDTQLKNIKLASIKHWKEICNYARERKEDFHEFLNCERRHIFKARTHCSLSFDGENKTNLEIFCQNLYEYNRCYRSIDKRCTESALEISYILDEAVMESYSNIVNLISHIINIPNTCNWIMKPNIKEINKNKELRESVKTDKQSFQVIEKKNNNIINLNDNDGIENNEINEYIDIGHHHRAKHNNIMTTTLSHPVEVFDNVNEKVSLYNYNILNNSMEIVFDENDRESSGFIEEDNNFIQTTEINHDNLYDNHTISNNYSIVWHLFLGKNVTSSKKRVRKVVASFRNKSIKGISTITRHARTWSSRRVGSLRDSTRRYFSKKNEVHRNENIELDTVHSASLN
uniref:CPG4 domain-containing protein n=1 Tax=Parastrongyloides trichosuri TaxID=131310 RepID=A0A0N4ZTI4_PARTI